MRVCQYLQAPAGHPNCPHGPATPDLSQTRYDAPGDLKKPIITASTVEPGSSSFTLKTRIANLSSLPSERALIVSLRPANATNAVSPNAGKPVSSLNLPKSASDAPQSFALDFQVPDKMPPGSYDVMLAMAAPPDAKGKPGFTPVSCGGGISKAASCFAGKIDVPPAKTR